MAINATATFQNHNGTGSQDNFAISFSFLANTEVDVRVGGVLKTLGTHYTISGSTVTFTSGNTPPSGTANITFTRNTNISNKKVDFADGSVLTETDLDNNSDQILFAQQEIINDFVKRDGSQTVTGDLVFEGTTDDANETTLAITDPTADRTITLPDRSGTVITSGDTGTVTSTMILDGTIVDGDIANTTITGGKLVNDTITSTQIGANAVTASELADDAVDTNAVQDDAITYSKIQNVSATDRILGRDSSGAGVIEEITPANLRTMINVEDGATADQTITEIKNLIAGSPLDSSHLAADSVTTSEIADPELTTLAGMQSGTASKLADSTALTADIADLNQIDGLTKQTTITDSDASFPTSGAVVDFVAAQIAPIGGLEVIATDAVFPDTQPQSGVVISIADGGGLAVNSSGSSTTARTVSGATVTINNFASNFNSSTIDAGVSIMVSSTGAGQIYNYHKATLKEADLLSLSNDINDFANRYRVTNGEPTSNNDEGDLIYDKQADKMKVFDSTTNAFKEVTSVGDFKFLFLCPAGGSGSPTINGSIASYDLRESSNTGASATVTSAAQLLVSVNGVVQKPNAGTSAPSEGFAMVDSNTIIFSSNLPSSAEVFVIQIGSAIALQVPADNTVATAKIQNQAVTSAKIADEAVTLAKLEHGTSSNNGKFLRANNGADPTFETISFQSLQDASGNTRVLVDTNFVNILKPLKFDTDPNNIYRITIDGPTTLTKDSTYTLPEDGSAGQFLKTNGSGVLSFATALTELSDDTSPQLGGDLQSNGHDIDIADNDKAVFGNGNDLQIYHDSSTNIIDTATSNLEITHGSEKLATFAHDGQVELYHDNVKKFETTANGVLTSGKIFVEQAGTDQTYLTLNADLGTNNNRELLFKGPSSDSPDEPFRIDTGNSLAFLTDGQEAFRIQYNRNVGFGTTSPSERLHIGDGHILKFHQALANTDGASMGSAAIRANVNSNTFGAMHTRAGNAGNRRHLRFYNPNGIVGEIRTQNNGTTFSTSSDYRLKENAVAIDDGITRLKTLKPYKFNFKSAPNVIVDGFFAHEATQIPEAVGGDKDEVVTQAMVDAGDYQESELGDPIYQSIDHSRFVPLLTAALQDAVAKIETLETKVAALEAG